MVMNRPEALLVALPRPSTARLKMAPHMTEVQRPQRTSSRADSGTFTIWKAEPVKAGMLTLVEAGAKMAQITSTRATPKITGESWPSIAGMMAS